MGQNTKEILEMMIMKEMGLRLFLMGKNMKANFIREKYMEKVFGLLLMGVLWKEYGIVGIKMEYLRKRIMTEKSF